MILCALRKGWHILNQTKIHITLKGHNKKSQPTLTVRQLLFNDLRQQKDNWVNYHSHFILILYAIRYKRRLLNVDRLKRVMIHFRIHSSLTQWHWYGRQVGKWVSKIPILVIAEPDWLEEVYDEDLKKFFHSIQNQKGPSHIARMPV